MTWYRLTFIKVILRLSNLLDRDIKLFFKSIRKCYSMTNLKEIKFYKTKTIFNSKGNYC